MNAPPRLLDEPDYDPRRSSAQLAAEILELDAYLTRVRLQRDLRKSVLRARMMLERIDRMKLDGLEVRLYPRKIYVCSCCQLPIGTFSAARHPSCRSNGTENPVEVVVKTLDALDSRDLRVQLREP